MGGFCLREILPWLEFDDFERPRHLHTTVARKSISKKFDEIWRFVSGEGFEFNSMLDNVAILQRVGDKWVIHKKYCLK